MAIQRQYLVIDLKSFYASVECVERGLDPMTTDLVVADLSRTQKTICLAVSPSLKAKGVRNRCRLFEIPSDLHPIIARPRMAHYIKYSADIYEVYLKYISPDDMHVYSIDEVFLDVTGYLTLYGCTARELGERIRADVVRSTGIPATCGLGTNLYLAKVALDISAKHRADFFGELNEQSYRETLWNHRPITDFWRVGPGYAKRLANLGIYTMGQVALSSQDILYQTFGVDAEILIDHAWGREPVTIADIKAYKSKEKSLCSGQVLSHDKTYHEAYVVVKEMADELILKLIREGLLVRNLTLYIGYKLTREEQIRLNRSAQVLEGRAADHGLKFRWQEFSEGGTLRLKMATNSRTALMPALGELYTRVARTDKMIHRLTLNFEGLTPEGPGQQLDLFSDVEALSKEKRRQQTVLAIKEKFGKNAMLKGIDLLPEATQRERNAQIGGHRSGEENECK